MLECWSAGIPTRPPLHHSNTPFLRSASERAFSLIELLVSAGILLLLMAGVFSQVAKMQKFSNTEEKKRDMFQNVREALDQMNRDIHAAGYPNRRGRYNWYAAWRSNGIGYAKRGIGKIPFLWNPINSNLLGALYSNYFAHSSPTTYRLPVAA